MATMKRSLCWALALSLAFHGAPIVALSPAYALQDDDDIEDEIEDSIEEDLESDIEDAIEEDLEAELEDSIEADIEADLESDIEAAIEEDLESDIEDSIEEDLEAELEDSIEADIEADLEDDIEADIEDDLEGDIEDDIENELEDDLEDDLEEDLDEDLEEDAEDELEDEIDDDSDDEEASEDDDNDEGTDVEAFRIDFDDFGQEIRAEERLVLLDASLEGTLEARGYTILSSTPLNGLGLVVSRVSVPVGFDLEAEVQAFSDLGNVAEIDFNHVYRLASEPSSQNVGRQTHRPITVPRGSRIGMIDTAVELDHPTLTQSFVSVANFAPRGRSIPSDHGTAVASLLVGRGTVQGYAPAASLYAASAFTVPANGNTPAASANSLVQSINWLVEQQTTVINMSLAGPPNRILEATIISAHQQGYMVVAAMGNDGPSAPPSYPAGYNGVIAVTAVNDRNRVFRRAGRGPHIDFSAPGVNVPAAARRGRVKNQTGTSFASPYAAAVLLSKCGGIGPCRTPDQVERGLRQSATDLGASGFDEIYGWGLIRP